MAQNKPRKPGRPARAASRDDVREQLIQTAAVLFGERGYAAVSLREISERAGVTPALIAYYFDDKQGLLRTVLEMGLSRLLVRIQEIMSVPDDESLIEHFIEGYLGVLTENPWIPQLLVREVVSADGPARQQFVEQFAVKATRIVPARIAKEVREGRLRAGLDPRLTMLSLLGMCVLPYIAEPILGPLLGYDIDESFGNTYIEHVKSLFFQGAGGTP